VLNASEGNQISKSKQGKSKRPSKLGAFLSDLMNFLSRHQSSTQLRMRLNKRLKRNYQ
jgi:hypothetical protein